MDYAVRVDAVERELASLVAALAGGPLDAGVPTCPDFSLDDLAKHVGQFCGFWAHVLCAGTSRPLTPFSDNIGPQGRARWVEDLARHLGTELRAASPDTEVWTWYEPDQTAAFVARRCSHELAVHRVDAQLARGTAAPIDAELAADGIEEIFVLLERPRRDDHPRPPGPARTLHLHGTDHSPAEWLITLGADGVQVAREHAKGDLTLDGSVSDLEMLLYQRPTVGSVERTGDASVLDAFHAEFTFG